MSNAKEALDTLIHNASVWSVKLTGSSWEICARSGSGHVKALIAIIKEREEKEAFYKEEIKLLREQNAKLVEKICNSGDLI